MAVSIGDLQCMISISWRGGAAGLVLNANYRLMLQQKQSPPAITGGPVFEIARTTI